MIEKPFKFLYISYAACMTVNGNLTVHNMLITHGVLKMASSWCREVDEVREERLRRREHDRLRRERETNEERQRRLKTFPLS